MSDGVLAGLVVALHFAFVLFVLFGGLLVLRWPSVRWVHLPAACWGAFVEFSGRICPLTPLENSLRRQAGLTGYQGGFIDHYIMPVLYPHGLTRAVQLVLGAIVIAFNVAIYWRMEALRRNDSSAQ